MRDGRFLNASRFFAVVVFFFFMVACGKKGAPTLTGFEKPGPVKDLHAVQRENALVITWSYPPDAREGIKGFHIERAEVSEEKPGGKETAGSEKGRGNIGFVKNDASLYLDKDCLPGHRYIYRIHAVSLRNNIGGDSPVVSFAPVIAPPPPVDLSYAMKNDELEINWRGIVPGARFNVYRRLEGGDYPTTPLNKTPLAGTLFRVGAEMTRTVYYAVRTVYVTPSGEALNEGGLSREAAVNPSSFVPDRPHGLIYVPSPRKLYLSWNANPESWITVYRIYRQRPGESGFALIGTALTPVYTDATTPVSGTRYAVAAVGPAKESALSDPLEIHIPGSME